MKSLYNTSSYQIEREYVSHICIYCNKPINKVVDFIDERDSDDYYPCTCTGALEEKRLIELIKSSKFELEKLQKNAINKNEFVLKKLQFDKKIEEIESAKRALNLRISLQNKESE